MKKLSDWLLQNSKTWIVLLFFFLLLFFVFLVLPVNTRIISDDNQILDIPDLSFWYTPEQLYKTAESYGENGRLEYVKMHAGFDLIWPMVYVGFLTVSLSWIYKKYPGGGKASRLNLIPIFAGVFDYLENLLTSIVMLQFPGHSRGISFLAPITTSTKWVLVYLSVLSLLGGLVFFGIRFIMSKRKNTIKAS